MSGELLRELKGHDADIHGVAFSADGTSLVTTSSDQTARLWDAATGEFLLELRFAWQSATKSDPTRLKALYAAQKELSRMM